jgi:uncharacterized membrane protein
MGPLSCLFEALDQRLGGVNGDDGTIISRFRSRWGVAVPQVIGLISYGEAAVSSKSRNRRRKNTGSPHRATNVREQKRAQFQQGKSNTKLHLMLAGIALVIVAAVAAFVVMGRGGGAEAATATTAAPSGDITLALSQVNDGKAHFYSYDAGGTTVKYFVLADKTGTVRAALDACEVCFQFKKGYHQQGDAMQCNNCGKIFPSDKINVITGGCNPIPLKKSIANGKLTITTGDLQQGAQYF